MGERNTTTKTTKTTKTRQRGTALASAGLALIMAFSGCGAVADKAVERAFEEAIEAGIEADGGESVEIDLDTENGSFSVTGEDGEEVSVSIDGDEGTMTIEADDEEVVLSVDEEQGTLTVEGDDGDASLEFGSTELPASWPEWMPAIDGPVISSFGMDSEADGSMLVVVFSVDEPHASASEVAAELASAGFTEQRQATTETDLGTTKVFVMERGDTQVTVMGATGDDNPLSVNIVNG